MRHHASILGPALLGVLVVCCANSSAQKKSATAALTDISNLGPQRDAIVRVLNQGIMPPLSPGGFGPLQITTRRQFVVAVHRLFRLASVQKQPQFHDVPPTDPDFDAISSVVPFMHLQAFCPGCALNNDFRPDAPISLTLQAVTLTSVLNSRHQIELVNPSEAGSILATPDLPQIAAPARVFLAAAVQNKIVSLDELKTRKTEPTRADTAVLLDTIQKRFKIPNVPQP